MLNRYLNEGGPGTLAFRAGDIIDLTERDEQVRWSLLLHFPLVLTTLVFRLAGTWVSATAGRERFLQTRVHLLLSSGLSRRCAS
jgi:hypothetical protein